MFFIIQPPLVKINFIINSTLAIKIYQTLVTTNIPLGFTAGKIPHFAPYYSSGYSGRVPFVVD